MTRVRGRDKNTVVVQGTVTRAPKYYETKSRGREFRFTIITEGVFVDLVSPEVLSEPVATIKERQRVRVEGRLRQRRRTKSDGKKFPTVVVEISKLFIGLIAEQSK